MAVIAALFDFEEGHFLSSVKLAKDLNARGHEVFYLGPPSTESMVRQQGFQFAPIFGSLLASINRTSQARGMVADSEWFGRLVRGEALAEVMRQPKPALILTLSHFCMEALAIQAVHRVPVVLWTPFCPAAKKTRAESFQEWIFERFKSVKAADMSITLRAIAAAGYRARSLQDLTELALTMPELVTLPRAFELPGVREGDPRVFYIGTAMDLMRTEAPFSLSEIPSDRKVIFCSLGSQAELEPRLARRFFHAVLGTAAACPEWQFVLATGKGFDLAELAPVPANLHLHHWVAQLDVLRRADLVVTHCGSGTVKESILLGVPMVALPMMRDQFEMARRVVHHRLGVEGDLANIDAESLGMLIRQALMDLSLRERVAAMRRRCEESDRSSNAVDLVEAALAGRFRPAPSTSPPEAVAGDAGSPPEAVAGDAGGESEIVATRSATRPARRV